MEHWNSLGGRHISITYYLLLSNAAKLVIRLKLFSTVCARHSSFLINPFMRDDDDVILRIHSVFFFFFAFLFGFVSLNRPLHTLALIQKLRANKKKT